jgi:hypothetical protein
LCGENATQFPGIGQNCPDIATVFLEIQTRENPPMTKKAIFSALFSGRQAEVDLLQ